MVMEDDGVEYDHKFGSKKEYGSAICGNIFFHVRMVVIFIALVALQRRRIWRLTIICDRKLGLRHLYT
jgi:hypothetical protein